MTREFHWVRHKDVAAWLFRGWRVARNAVDCHHHEYAVLMVRDA